MAERKYSSDDTIPAVVAGFESIVVDTDQALVAVKNLLAYPSGIMVDLWALSAPDVDLRRI